MIIIKKIKSYILFNYFKYLITNSLFFISLVWISQTLKILNIQFSDSVEVLDIILTSIAVLPSYLSPLLPILIIFTSIALGYKFINNNEVMIYKFYLNKSNFVKIFTMISFIILIFFSYNSEIIGPKTYKHYKEKELSIRNTLKLGFKNENEFHIGEELSLFFDSTDENIFRNVRAIIYDQNRFIISNNATLEFNENTFNIIFIDGERSILNSNEKSYTKFEKFTYSIINEKVEKLLYDKEHFNTLELLNSDDKKLIIHGHNRIYQYVFLLSILLISQKIIFFSNKDIYLKNNFLTIILIFVLIVINSFLQYSLKNDYFGPQTYYILNIIILLIVTNYIYRIYEIK